MADVEHALDTMDELSNASTTVARNFLILFKNSCKDWNPNPGVATSDGPVVEPVKKSQDLEIWLLTLRSLATQRSSTRASKFAISYCAHCSDQKDGRWMDYEEFMKKMVEQHGRGQHHFYFDAKTRRAMVFGKGE